MLKLQRIVLAVAGVVTTAASLVFLARNDGPQLVTGPISVSYDRKRRG